MIDLNNIYVKKLYERHEARKALLPSLGFNIPDNPEQWKIDEALIQSNLHKQRLQEKDNKKRLLDKAFSEVSFLKLSEVEELNWINKYYPECIPTLHGGSTATYIIYNAALATTAAPVKQPTGTAIRTMAQWVLATGFSGRIVEWGISFDGSAAATPGQCELVETGTVAATSLSTAYALADVQPFGDPNATANTSGTSGVPFNLGTSLSGFATAAVTEGSTTSTRMADIQMLCPTSPYIKQWPLGREFTFGYWGGAQHYLRNRVTFGTTINMSSYIICEI